MKVQVSKPISELQPLDVKCSDTRCNEGFHYYTSRVIPKGGKLGDCKECGDSSIDWDRIHRHNDIEYTFNSLKKELLRHVCWINDIDPKAILRANNRGVLEIVRRAKEILLKKVGHPPVTRWDNTCTPKDGSEIIHYAQHATATCCRRCMCRWHDIPLDIHLTNEHINFCAGLIERFVYDRIPNIPLLDDTKITIQNGKKYVSEVREPQKSQQSKARE